MVMRLLGGRAGGAERMFCATANLLADAGHDVTVVTCDSTALPPSFALHEAVARKNLWTRASQRAVGYRAVGWLARACPPFRWLGRNLYFVRQLYLLARSERPTLLISFLPPANTPSLLAGWLAGAAVLPTNHSVPEKDYGTDARWDQSRIDRMLRRVALRFAVRVHVLFPAYASAFPAAVRKKVVAIPNFVPDELRGVSPALVRRKEILAVGRLIESKNYALLIKAWSLVAARYPQWTVRIVGDGPETQALGNCVARLGLGETVHLVGPVADPTPLYRQAEIFCHPARFEGFGLAVAEALACGLPVVALKGSGGVEQLVREGVNGLLVDGAGGARALAAGLERLILDERAREDMRQRARASVQEFSFDSYRRRWIALVDDIAASGGIS